MREGKRVLPGESPEDFWDRMVGYSFWFAAGAISVLVWMDVGI